MPAWKSLPGIHWTKHRTNESALVEVGNWRKDGLLKYVHKMQLRYAARRDNNSLEKNCMLGMIDGQRNRGRQRWHWTDKVKT